MSDDQSTIDAKAGPVDRLGQEYFELFVSAHPFTATTFGVPGHDAEVPDVSAEAQAELGRRMASIRDRAAALSPERLDDTDRTSRALVMHDAQAVVNTVQARESEWQLGSLTGAASAVLGTVPKAVLTDARKAADYAERCARLPSYVEASAEALRRGMGDGLVASRRLVESTIATIDGYLGAATDVDPLLTPLEQVEDAAVRERVRDAVTGGVRPAMARLRDVLRAELLPVARPDEKCGVLHLPGGEDIYRRLVEQHTTTTRTPEDLHETGLRLAEQLREEFAELGGRVLGTSDFAEVTARLRDDEALRYASAEQIVTDARAALRRAEEAVPDWFGRRHRAPCEVDRMNSAEAETSVLGYYQPPAWDGSRPGRCWLNTSNPGSRARYECETLTFHETVPGHHLQFALAQELEELPAYRRFAYVTAYGEGWGLYTERLADEMGLYSSDLARFGMVSFDAWRAARLVVDTGLHSAGWSRRQAIDYLWESTALSMGNVVNEVDRYISMPGQALAYMTGRLEIARLRELAQSRLGSRFDITAFHDIVLGSGSIPLSQLADTVDRLLDGTAAPADTVIAD
ncbi:DUF885 domain-containing protein [Prauserella cavernicola]|uniref:DUF885 domain-containing protein n=1 Tax=Prauserella cavernicola TaxID=2800127 RepID=A0A934QXD9_9PSEU|nr:DUF885 domain-containing protein [Prauserella cavernicola]MBK1787279.1 DUF885 domain-containing protein [Prauserella cavernicola]